MSFVKPKWNPAHSSTTR